MGDGACSELRSRHCTPARATEQDSPLLLAAASKMAEPSSEMTSDESMSTKEPKAANATTAHEQKNRRCHPNHRRDNFAAHFPRVLKLVHEGLSLSREAVDIINSFIHDILERIATKAGHLACYTKCATITSCETTIRLMLPWEMGKHAVSRGSKAVLRYTRSKYYCLQNTKKKLFKIS
uniref:Core Histone H2A/H2B/H3 domain-containing protein n=1 Tax=Piliocolobus tephrosceles TaxID=591936 RepID=A0A8C9LS18_9PRIM